MNEISLRDYFAAAAMSGFAVNFGNYSWPHEQIAEMAYAQADAMLAEKERTPKRIGITLVEEPPADQKRQSLKVYKYKDTNRHFVETGEVRPPRYSKGDMYLYNGEVNKEESNFAHYSFPILAEVWEFCGKWYWKPREDYPKAGEIYFNSNGLLRKASYDFSKSKCKILTLVPTQRRN